MLCGKRDVGLHLMDAVTSFTGGPAGQTVYVEPYGQAIAIVGTFSSEEVGISMLEGNCSWVVGKEPTPSWSRATNVRSLHWKEAQELTLALKAGVQVDLTSKKIQSLVLGYF